MMKTKLSRTALILSLALGLGNLTTSSAQAESARDRAFGLGVVAGVPTGFSAQYNLKSDQSINGGLAWAFDSDWFQIWADYTWHFPRFVSSLVGEYSPIEAYVGVGATLLLFDKSRGAGALIRIPLGLDYKLSTAPIGFFFELVPGMIVAPKTDGELQGGIGARYYF